MRRILSNSIAESNRNLAVSGYPNAVGSSRLAVYSYSAFLPISVSEFPGRIP